jgi:hypothetical protein
MPSGNPFFMSQGDKSLKGEFFPRGSEAERRISFFAQSLTTEIPQPIPVDDMPTFTIPTPHYSEKVIHIFLDYYFCIAAHVFFLDSAFVTRDYSRGGPKHSCDTA